MGIPYSRQIHAAFDQVTPLVGASYRVLETTKNIAVLLAAISVLTVILFGLMLVAIFALLITTNPDLQHERNTIVTPVVKWLCEHGSFVAFLAILTVVLVLATWAVYGRALNQDELDALNEEESDSKDEKDGAANGDDNENEDGSKEQGEEPTNSNGK